MLTRRFFLACLVLLLLPPGFVGASPTIFKEAQPGRTLEFPRDFGAQPDYKQEWWYYSVHLESAAGDRLGYQLTFFRVALKSTDPKGSPSVSTQNIFAGHMALTIPARSEFISRDIAVPEILGLAAAANDHLEVRIDDWQISLKGDVHVLQARSRNLALDLRLTPQRPITLHGSGGYVARGNPTGSGYHYSLSRLATQGEVRCGAQIYKVSGTSWFDREFGTTILGPKQRGWDWFALQLNDGRDVMLYLLRNRDGGLSPNSYGAIIDPRGQVSRLGPGDFQLTPTGHWKSPRTAAVYPAGWQLTIPGQYASLTIAPTVADQEVTLLGLDSLTYWEGQVTVTGRRGPEPVSGRGYVELTGYVQPVPVLLDEPQGLGPKRHPRDFRP